MGSHPARLPMMLSRMVGVRNAFARAFFPTWDRRRRSFDKKKDGRKSLLGTQRDFLPSGWMLGANLLVRLT